MKKFKTIMIAIVAAFTVAGMSNVGAVAGNATGISDQNLTITRTITNAKNNITNTFGYTITESSSNPKVPGSSPATSGATGFPTTAQVVFNNKAPVSGTATETGTIDLSNTVFTENGNYEWTLTETSSTDNVNYPKDTTNTYTIKAVVRNSSDRTNGKLSNDQGKIVEFVVFDKDNNKLDLTAQQDPDQILFTSQTQYKHIEIKKEVTGNMADVDKDFTVTVTVGGNGTYNVYGSNNNVTEITAGTATALTLNHNDTIIIGAGANGSGTEEIPSSTTYTVVETPDGYTPTITVGTGTALTEGTATTGSKTVNTDNAENVVSIVNDLQQATITGAFLKVLPYVVIVAIAAAGVVYLVIRNKKQKAVEE